MKLIVGLGNPGPEYAGTRHNVGFEVVEQLASRWRVSLNAEKFHAWFGQADVRGERVVLLKPTTYMNRSGQAVLAAGRFYRLELVDLLVIADDFALPLGRLRIRKSGSAGSHNGLQDIVDRLGSETWCRLRVGIGEAFGDPKAFVLSRFSKADEEVVDLAVQRAADAAECWVAEGPELAMTRFNGDVTPRDAGERGEGSSQAR